MGVTGAVAGGNVPPSLNAHTVDPEIVAMYCSPSISYAVVGPPAAPVWNCHTRLPVFGSSASRLPSPDTWKSSPPAVVIAPLGRPGLYSFLQTILFVRLSMAATTP